MRGAFLNRSVRRLVGEDQEVTAAVYGWRRHRLLLPLAGFALALVTGAAVLAGVAGWPARLVLGGAGVAVAVAVSTDYLVVAATRAPSGHPRVVLCRASRFRQVATELLESWDRVEIELVGGTPLVLDWDVGGRRFSAPRRADRAMAVIRHATRPDGTE